MSALLIAAFALAGFAVSWPQRAMIASVPATAAGQSEASCASCGQRLGPPLLAVALVSASLLAAVADRIHPWPVLAAAAWLVICGVPLAFIDARVHRLPDVLTGSAYAGVMAFLLVAASTAGGWHELGRAALGGVILAGCYLTLAVISPRQVGLGDSKAAASAGSLLAWFSWQTLLVGAFSALALAAVYGLVLLTAGRATVKTQIAFGPFLLAGCIAAVLLAGSAGAG